MLELPDLSRSELRTLSGACDNSLKNLLQLRLLRPINAKSYGVGRPRQAYAFPVLVALVAWRGIRERGYTATLARQVLETIGALSSSDLLNRLRSGQRYLPLRPEAPLDTAACEAERVISTAHLDLQKLTDSLVEKLSELRKQSADA